MVKSLFPSFSRRWQLILLIFVGLTVVYALRVNMSVAVSAMQEELGWSDVQKGYVLSSFYWGYTIGQIPASLYAQVNGAKNLFAASIFLPSLLTLFIPIAARTSYGVTLLLRVFIGLLESASFPAVFHLIPLWIPTAEKTIMIVIAYAGMYAGDIIGFSVSGVLLDIQLQPSNYINATTNIATGVAGDTAGISSSNHSGWPLVFYLFGAIGLVYVPVWLYVISETPESHPHIGKEELAFIQLGREGVLIKNNQRNSNNIRSRNQGGTTIGGTGDHRKNKYSKLDANDEVNCVSPSSFAVELELSDNNNKIDRKNHNDNNEDDVYNVIIVDESPLAQDDNETIRTDDDQICTHNNNNSNNHCSNNSNSNSNSNVSVLSPYLTILRGVPLREFFSNKTSLTLLCGSFANGWIAFTLLSEMPIYLSTQLHYAMSTAGVYCIVPYTALFVSSLVSGYMFTTVCHKRFPVLWSIARIRCTAHTVAYGGSSLCLLCCCYCRDRNLAYFFIVMAQVCFGFHQSGLACSYIDIAPQHSGFYTTIGNTLASVAGIIGPIIISHTIQQYNSNNSRQGWRVSFYYTCLVCGVSVVTWWIHQPANLIPALNKTK